MLSTKKILSTIIATSALSFGASSIAAAAEPTCEIDRPVFFSGQTTESNLVITEIHRFVVENGYGCNTETLPTETIPGLAALERGDLDVYSEVWPISMGHIWEDVIEGGKVISSGHLFDAGEGWFIPKYVQERFPDLKSVADLPKYKDEFQDPESPNKGRFYGCPAGWSCDVISANLFKAYDLGDSYTYYQPGTGAAQKAALMSEYRRQNNIVFYYWYPTPLVGALDLVELELPEYDAEKYKCLSDSECPDPQPSDFPVTPAYTALNADFAGEAPQLKALFDNNFIPLDSIYAALAELEESGDEPADIAIWYLNNYPEVWTEWVPEDVAERVQAAL